LLLLLPDDFAKVGETDLAEALMTVLPGRKVWLGTHVSDVDAEPL
jgi:hypothetical protein